MSRWHITRDDEALTLSRQKAARFDVSVTRALGPGRISRTALAHQVRQDVWRALRRVRGFSPAVRVRTGTDGIDVTAGGALPHPRLRTAAMEARITEVLEDPANRRRWLTRARRSC